MRPLSLALLTALLAACGGSDENVAVTYSLTAKQNYDKGMGEREDENWPEAIRYFTYVKERFPFTRWAPLAELRIADVNFERGSFPEAIDLYKNFIRLHPTHAEVENGYAAFRAAEAYYKQVPDEWFLVPPAHEKDQTATAGALGELEAFIANYPESKFIAPAKKHRAEVLSLLVSHELYVARFYLDRDKPKGAILRLEHVLTHYPGSRDEPAVKLLLGQTYLRMGDIARARETFQGVARDAPGHWAARKAHLYLDHISRRAAR